MATNTRDDGWVPRDVPADWHPPTHPYPDMRCPRCAARLAPWGTLLVRDRSLVVLHCGDHPAEDRLWDERTNLDYGRLRDTARA